MASDNTFRQILLLFFFLTLKANFMVEIFYDSRNLQRGNYINPAVVTALALVVAKAQRSRSVLSQCFKITS